LITVAVDAEHTRQTSAGTARASRALVKALAARDDVKPIVVGGGPLLDRGTLKKRLTTLHQDLLWYPTQGRRAALRVGAQVYHCPTPRAPLTRGKLPLVVTIHDLVPVLFPETMTPWSRVYTRATFKRVVNAADMIVTPSADTANDVSRHLGVREDRIRVVWNGVDPFFFTKPAEPRVAKPYFLFVGTQEPRKNLHRLVEAVGLLRKRGWEQRLVVAGAGAWGDVRLDSPFVERIGRVSDTDLHSLYAHADCLVLPSLHEGFGLPAIEAMAAGTPVVAAAKDALPEVVGNAGILVDPYDSTAIANAIEAALGRRDQLRAAGLARAAQFSWEKAAESMVSVYRELI
jgi:glycosyltransferase involved in cell wall biosynthesis